MTIRDIRATGTYEVTKYVSVGESWEDVKVELIGFLPGEDVKRLLKGYKYEEDFEMWFSPKGIIGYVVEER